jgi:hypothetical protein
MSKKPPVKDGDHRPLAIGPERGEYKEYSRTSSGWTIYSNRSASWLKRWKITHPFYGERFFAQHDDILKFTVEHMREEYAKHPERFTLRSGPEVMKQFEKKE